MQTPTLYQMWHVVLPLKGTADAKSRLKLPSSARDRLVGAMADDTLNAVMASTEVVTVSVLSRRSGRSIPSGSTSDVEVIIQPQRLRSLDQALTWFAANHADSRCGLAVVVADLPALQPASLTAVLQGAARHRLAMVADADESGTTILTAVDAAGLRPHFGEHSAAAHRVAGAVQVPGTPDTRRDVDTAHDLTLARHIGLGPRTREVLAELALDR